jgi:hypothetical protein
MVVSLNNEIARIEGFKQRLSRPLIPQYRYIIVGGRLTMINKEVTGAVIVTKPSAIRISAVLAKNEISIPVVLANTIKHEMASCTVVIARHKMRLRLNQYPCRSVRVCSKRWVVALRIASGRLHDNVVDEGEDEGKRCRGTDF